MTRRFAQLAEVASSPDTLAERYIAVCSILCAMFYCVITVCLLLEARRLEELRGLVQPLTVATRGGGKAARFLDTEAPL